MSANCNDNDQYISDRRIYFNTSEWLSSADNEVDLLKFIKSDEIDKQIAMTKKFQQKYVTAYGSAAKKSLDVIYNELTDSK